MVKKLIEFHLDNREITNRILKAYAADARYVLEIGRGTSTTVLSEAIVNHEGHIWSIDLKSEDVPPNSNRTYLNENSLTVPWHRCIDLLYLDGCHRPEHVRRELEKFGKWVNPGGWILLDDVRNYDHPRLEQVIEAFCSHNALDWFYAAPEPAATGIIPVTHRLGELPIDDFHSATDCEFCLTSP